MENLDISILNLQFKNEISYSEIHLLRGAILNALDGKADVLFHNHIGESFRYSYPLIQYKRIHKKAAIFCLREGTDAIGQFLSKGSFSLCLGERRIDMEIESVHSKKFKIQPWQSLLKYRLKRWLPLNSENYKKYKEMDELVERISFLEKILVSNLLSFFKGIGFHITSKIICKLVSISDPYQVVNKGVKLIAFDIEFKTNFSLPDYLGIGKNASIGYGVVTHVQNEKKR
ncbi:CRISPR-associated endonuclease Cas6 [Bacteroides sp. AN502(2024)]|uniref:CRISPR-associated endonuclease Cas6 n=1 Tax=Bacteroides sp. AN502(2024) TaxID=3160599 RepID=UPI003511791A